MSVYHFLEAVDVVRQDHVRHWWGGAQPCQDFWAVTLSAEFFWTRVVLGDLGRDYMAL